MNFLTKYFLFFILTFYLIECASIEELEENTLHDIKLADGEIEYSLPISSPDEQKMTIELIFSEPIKYDVNFYQTTQPEEEAQNNNQFFYNEGTQKRYIHPKRRLVEESEETVVAESDITTLGKRKIILGLTNDMNSIIIKIALKDGEELSGNERVFIKFYITKSIEKEKYSLFDQKVNVEQDKDFLSITFKGIKQQYDEADLQNFTAKYDIKLFDKKSLESKYENIYIYSYTNEDKALVSKELKLKGEITKKDNHVKIQAGLNNKEDQILLINAKVKNENEAEQLLQYEKYVFKVEEESGERVWPEEETTEEETKEEETKEEETKEEETKEEETKEEETKEEETKEEETKEEETKEEEHGKEEEEHGKEEEETKEEEHGKEEENKEEEKSKDDDDEDYRDENKSKFYIILVCFIVAVIITIIAVLIYIKNCANKETSIEEEQDYKDVGGIVKNNEEGDKKEDTNKGKKINEEEE